MQSLSLRALILGISLLVGLPAFAADSFYSRNGSTALGEVISMHAQGDIKGATSRLMQALAQGDLGDDTDLGRLFLADSYAEQALWQRAMATYRSLAKESRDSQIQGRAWLGLAKIALERGDFKTAAEAAGKADKLDAVGQTEQSLIKARTLLQQGKVSQAVAVLPKLDDDSDWALYQRYNLGVSLLKHYRDKHGALLLHQLGNLDAGNNRERIALRDQANLSLGFSILQLNKPAKARQYFQKVGLKGALSNQALLGMGWAYSAERNYEKALVYWLELQKRTTTADPYYYEVLLAVPYAFGSAKAYGQASHHYQTAIESFKAELKAMELAEKAIPHHTLIATLSAAPTTETSWISRWRHDAADPGNHFIPLLLQNPAFMAAVQEYRHLLQLTGNSARLKKQLTDIQHDRDAPTVSSPLDRAHQQEVSLSQGLHSALNRQKDTIEQMAVDILKRYHEQLVTYERQARYGLAQVIEQATFQAGEEEAP